VSSPEPLDADWSPTDDGVATTVSIGGTVDHKASDTPAPEGADPAGTGRRRGGLGCAVEIAETVVLTLVIFFVIQNFVAQPFQVKLHSMERTFSEGDYVLVDRLTGRWSPYSRGQVVVFQPPPAWTDQPEPYIKRVIGVGGDTVEVHDGQVFVNGTALDEPYLFRNDAGVAEPTETSDQSRWVVPDGELFVMGDHRQESADSRVFGAIPSSSVIGRGVVRYWPLSKFWIVETPTYDNISAP
jgi:signal peptidase I